MSLWLPSRRLTRSLVAITVVGRGRLHGFDARRRSSNSPSNCNFYYRGWATGLEHWEMGTETDAVQATGH